MTPRRSCAVRPMDCEPQEKPSQGGPQRGRSHEPDDLVVVLDASAATFIDGADVLLRQWQGGCRGGVVWAISYAGWQRLGSLGVPPGTGVSGLARAWRFAGSGTCLVAPVAGTWLVVDGQPPVSRGRCVGFSRRSAAAALRSTGSGPAVGVEASAFVQRSMAVVAIAFHAGPQPASDRTQRETRATATKRLRGRRMTLSR